MISTTTTTTKRLVICSRFFNLLFVDDISVLIAMRVIFDSGWMAVDTWVTLMTGASEAMKDVAKTTRCCLALFYASSTKMAKSTIQTLSTS